MFACSSLSPVIPEVTLVASQTRVALGNSVTLTCTVTRANPSTDYTYTWIFTGDDGTPTSIDGETTDTLEISAVMESDYGDYTCNVTNTAGTGESNTATIEQGCKLFSMTFVVTSYIVVLMGPSFYCCPQFPLR